VPASWLPSQWADRAAPTRRLRVITFNVQFLPGPGEAFNKRPDAAYRARTLGRRLADYDIIGLNEVFAPAARATLLGQLRERLGDEFHCVTPPDRESSAFGIGSGLAIVSRLPVLASHSLVYGNDSSVWKHGVFADGFAAKGALHARLGRSPDAPGDWLDVFVTHLESVEADARAAQFLKLAGFIRAHADPRRPALILGDFNTTGDPADLRDPASPYHRLCTALEGGRPGAAVVDLWPRLAGGQGGTDNPDAPDGGQRIDYVFLSNPAGRAPVLHPLSVRVNRFADPRVTSLSDHCAVEADLHWGRRP
jgi:endonuclease/exonuclease/phosphatase family metal-dependent hydrolase